MATSLVWFHEHFLHDFFLCFYSARIVLFVTAEEVECVPAKIRYEEIKPTKKAKKTDKKTKNELKSEVSKKYGASVFSKLLKRIIKKPINPDKHEGNYTKRIV